MKILMIFTLLCGVVFCDYEVVIKDGPCRQLPAAPFFQPKRYVGLWYEQMRYEDFFQLDGDCGTATYKLEDDGSLEVVNAHYWFKNSTFKDAVGQAVLSYPEAKPISGQFSVRFSPRQPLFNNYNVLYTDYDNISVIWNCKPMPENKHKENFWVLSRTPALTNQGDIDFVQNLIDEFFDRSSVRITEQGEKCDGHRKE